MNGQGLRNFIEAFLRSARMSWLNYAWSLGMGIGPIVEIQGLWIASEQGANGLDAMLESMEPISTLSRSLRAPLGELRSGLLGILDGNAVIEEWGRRASELLPDNEEPDESQGNPDE